jgi:AcrR family transcriptional regulator
LSKGNVRRGVSKAQWLETAMVFLRNNSVSDISVEGLAKELGIAKSGFYWHFKSRDNFFRQLIEYWDEQFTQTVIANISSLGVPPEERLLELMRLVLAKRLDRFEMPVRAWAQQNPALAPLVRSVDRHRMLFVNALFREMGFDEGEADMRTRIFLTYMITQRYLLPDTASSKQLTELHKRMAFFIHH